MENTNRSLYKIALYYSIATIVFATIEAFVSIYFGYKDETLTLFGFGIGSILEIISALGVSNMIIRLQNNHSEKTKGEQTALKITGFSFYLLALSLIVGAVISIYENHQPYTTLPGIIIALFSIAIMYILAKGKISIGTKLNLDAIIEDGECTMMCIYMSVILLASSAIYYFTGYQYADVFGSIALAYLCYKEGKECFEILKGKSCKC